MGAECSAPVHTNSWGSYTSEEGELYDAALGGDLAAVRAQLDVGAQPDRYRHTTVSSANGIVVTLGFTAAHFIQLRARMSHVNCTLRSLHFAWLGDQTGQTPFHAACSRGHMECAQALANAGADTALPAVIGNFPHIAFFC